MTNTISYAGYVFPYTTLDVAQTPVYADDGITQNGVKYDFSIKGHIIAASESDWLTEKNKMEMALNSTRQPFFVQWVGDGGGGGSKFWDFSEASDVDWGPKPGSLRLNKFAGGRAANYEWSVSIISKQCFGADGSTCTTSAATENILSLSQRWDHAIDEGGMSRVTCSGKLVIRSGAISQGLNAESYKSFCRPPMQKWFRQVSAHFNIHPNGREMDYTFVDQEMMWGLPKPIVAGDASFTVRADQNLMAYFSLSGWFEALPSNPTRKADILNAISNVMRARFPMDLAATTALIFTSWEFTETIYSRCRIAFRIEANTTASEGTADVGIFLAGLGAFSTIPPTDMNGEWIGTGGLYSQLPTLRDACGGVSSGGSQSGVFTTENPNYSGGPLHGGGTEGPGGTTPGGKASDAQKAFPYLAYHERSSYEYDMGLTVLNPKTADAAPVFQQTHNPGLIVIKTGYATRYARGDSGIPEVPFPSVVDWTILQATIDPLTYEPIGDGSYSKATVHWRFICRLNKAVKTASTMGWMPAHAKNPSISGSVPIAASVGSNGNNDLSKLLGRTA